MATRLSIKANKPPAKRKRKAYTKTAAGAARLRPNDLALDLWATPRIASLAVLVTCLVGLAYFSFDNRFYVYAPTVVGNQYTDANDIIAAGDLMGMHVAWVRPERAAQTIIRRLPDVSAAEVSCTLPAQCIITVQERQPAFVWRQGEVQAWVDADGVVFLAHGEAANVPVIDMPSGSLPLPGTTVSPSLLSGVQALVQILPDLKTVRYSNEHGLEISDLVGGWPVYLGSGPDMETRVTVWRALSDNLAQRGLRPTFINVQNALAPYYSTQ